jgi:sugar phosphate isomerase/epimerase
MKKESAMEYKIGSGFAPFSPCSDRFVPEGYHEKMNLDRQIEAAAAIKGLTGVGLDYPYQFKDPSRVAPMLAKHRLALSTLEIGLYPDRKWSTGTLTSPDPGVRRDALAMCKRTLEVAAELGAADVLMWPGQDGFDYPFQADYDATWKRLVDGIGEVASHRPDVKIAIEYKKQEPRTNLFVRNAGVAMTLVREVNLPSVGACIDLGHSLAGGENPGEAAALIARSGKLFQVHVNDNYRDWDHDLIVGSVSFWETLEFFYWIVRSGYQGWYLLDIFPYRIDGPASLQKGVDRVRYFLDAARALCAGGLGEALAAGDTLKAQDVVWDLMLAKR